MVTLNVSVDKISMLITDLKGLVLMNSERQVSDRKFEIDATKLKPGSYFLRLQTKDGNKTYNFIKL